MSIVVVQKNRVTERSYSTVQDAFTKGNANEQSVLEAKWKGTVNYPAAFVKDDETGELYGPILRP